MIQTKNIISVCNNTVSQKNLRYR